MSLFETLVRWHVCSKDVSSVVILAQVCHHSCHPFPICSSPGPILVSFVVNRAAPDILAGQILCLKYVLLMFDLQLEHSMKLS